MSFLDPTRQDPDFYNATEAEKRAEYTVYFGNPDDSSSWFPYADSGGNYATLKEMRGGFTGGIDGKTPTWIDSNGAVRGRILTHEEMMTGRVPYPSGKTLGDALKEAGTAICKVIKAVAPFIAMIPGVGTVVGTALYAVGSIGAGDRIDQVAIDTIEQALPEPTRKSYREAVNMGYAVARGQRVDKVAVDLARSEALADGGPQAVAAFDAGVSIGTGKGLQDAGFKLLGGWAQGTDLSARAAAFTEDIIKAQQAGLPLDKFLIQEAGTQFLKSVPAAQQAYVLAKAIQFFKDHPDQLIDDDFADLAARAGVPISAIRAAIICIEQMADGTIVVNEQRAAHFEEYTDAGKAADQNADAAIAAFGPLANKGMTVTDAGKSVANTNATAIQAGLLAKQGYAASLKNPRIAMARRIGNPDAGADWKYGFDVATALCAGKTQDGPGQRAIKDSLATAKMKSGFDYGQSVQFTLSKEGPQMSTVGLTARVNLISPATIALLAAQEAQGRAAAAANPTVAAARSGVSSPEGLRGFDIATAECAGKYLDGPGQIAKRDLLADTYGGMGTLAGQNAAMGFNIGQAVQHGIAKVLAGNANNILLSGNPNVAAGQLVATGLAGNTQSGAQKAATVAATIQSNSQTKAGVAQGIAVHKGFFARIAEFFGL